jgi:hypothetical protein
MSRIPITIVALAFALVAFAAACSEDRIGPLPSPSSQFPSETPVAPTGTTGGLPAASLAEGSGNLTNGEVTLHVAGDVEVDKTLVQLVTAVFTPSPGGVALVWTAGGTDASTVGIGGPSFVGSQATSASLSLTLVVHSEGEILGFSSTNGECEITIDVATEAELSGGFACRGLTSSTGEVVDVSASFEATG